MAETNYVISTQAVSMVHQEFSKGSIEIGSVINDFAWRLAGSLTNNLFDSEDRQNAIYENAVTSIASLCIDPAKHFLFCGESRRLLILSSGGTEIVDFHVVIGQGDDSSGDSIAVRHLSLDAKQWDVECVQRRPAGPGMRSIRRQWTFRHLPSGHHILIATKRHVGRTALGESDDDDFALELAAVLGWKLPTHE